jgi:hypothetical protein
MVIFRMEGWEEMESEDLKKKGKTNKQTSMKKQNKEWNKKVAKV